MRLLEWKICGHLLTNFGTSNSDKTYNGIDGPLQCLQKSPNCVSIIVLFRYISEAEVYLRTLNNLKKWNLSLKKAYCRKWRGTKKPLDESERGEWKSCLKTQHSEN